MRHTHCLALANPSKACHKARAGKQESQVKRHTSHVTRHTSHVTRHTSHVTRHTSNVTRHTSHVTRHSSSLRRPNAAQIRHDVGLVLLNGDLQGSAVAAAQGVRSTCMRSARVICGHPSLAVRSALCSTNRRQAPRWPYIAALIRGVRPLQTRSRSSGRPQYLTPHFSIIHRGITRWTWRSRLRRSSAEYRT